ncbi:cupin domain-containing protein [Psychroserpens sp. AS72]|uniref:cupin domain-containing protein n=1 Tax=Psychroserpens sp. AS72 TaxID=3135775 RepID=UPI00316E03F4
MINKKEYLKSSERLLLFALLSVTILLQSCGNKEAKTESVAESQKTDITTKTQKSVGSIMEPNAGEHLWVFPKNKDTLGSGGKLQIFMDANTHPHASASFAKYELGVGGALPEHKHNITEEIAYFLSGEGIVITYENEKRIETPVKEGYVWYTAPGEYHSFKNTGNEPLKLIFAIIPNDKDGLLSFFKKVGAEPGKDATVFSPEEFGKIATEHDLILKPAKVD